jgi:2-methylisocitrate lyase-like PEP mutase family enzyme
MAAVVSVPLTADLEAGYGTGLDAVIATVCGAAEAGAIGLNIEDGMDHYKGTMFDEQLCIDRIAARRLRLACAQPVAAQVRWEIRFPQGRIGNAGVKRQIPEDVMRC